MAAYLRAEAWRRLDRVETLDRGRNARCALALLDAAAYAGSLADDDALIVGLAEAGCFGPHAAGPFEPGASGIEVIRSWESGEPWQLLLAIRAAARNALKRA